MESTERSDHIEIVQKLSSAFSDLAITVDHQSISMISDLVMETMSGPWRSYHTPKHIFDLTTSNDSISVLAAVFHDVVYVQVDGTIHLNLAYYLSPFVKQKYDEIVIRDISELPKDQSFEMALAIFGFSPSQTLSATSGQNEFLSAIVAAKILEPFLSLQLIAQVVTCIELTIPFRPDAVDNLYNRLEETNRIFSLNLTVTNIDLAIKRAVLLSNQDVASFSSPSSASFLDITWTLLPETNKALSRSSNYTVKEYRIALQKMELFFSFLRPEIIVHQFNGVPNQQIYRQLIDSADYNLSIGRLYMRVKVITIAIIEALSSGYSLDAQISLIMGDLPDPDRNILRLSDFLPTVSNPYRPQTRLEENVLDLLDIGRTQETAYDIPNSPLSSFVVKMIGFPEIRINMENAKLLFNGSISPEVFLYGFNSDFLSSLVDALLSFMRSRLDSFSNWSTGLIK